MHTHMNRSVVCWLDLAFWDYSLFVYVCFCCVRCTFFSTMTRDWSGRMSPKWHILWQVGQNLNKINQLNNAKHKTTELSIKKNNQQLKHMSKSCMYVNNVRKNTGYNAIITYQLDQTERGLSGSGPWAWRLLYSDLWYGLNHRRLPRTTAVIHQQKQNKQNASQIKIWHQVNFDIKPNCGELELGCPTMTLEYEDYPHV